MTEEVPCTIIEAAEWLRTGRASSVDLTERALARAKASQDTLAAFVSIMEDAALAAAQIVDTELSHGTPRSPLHGIPVAVKDILATADAPTTANSRVLDRAWGKRGDATSVRKLREAGAVLIGKLGLYEFAIGFPDATTGFRIPKNPWDLTRTPGGSSSGTAAAIAGGIILGGLGTDTGSSIRGPSAHTGISGMKPTFGRVSKEGCVPLSYSLDHVGPMARTARDCALMLQVLAGFDELDPCAADVGVPNMLDQADGVVSGVRIGVPRDYGFDVPELDAEVSQAVLNAVDCLATAGAVVVDVVIPHADVARSVQRAIMYSEAFAYHEADLQSRPDAYGRHTRQQIRQGAFYTAADYVQAQRVRALIDAEVRTAFAGVDVLVMPTMPSVAAPLEGYDADALLRQPNFTAIWNLTGLPAMSICCGFSDVGLPIGLQIVGKPFDEPMIFKVADAYQRVTDWHTRIPTSGWEGVARDAR